MASPVNYFVYELKRKLTAEKAGTYATRPGDCERVVRGGMEGSSYTGRRLVAVAPAVPVEVREVPVSAARDVLRRNRQLPPGGVRQPHRAARG